MKKTIFLLLIVCFLSVSVASDGAILEKIEQGIKKTEVKKYKEALEIFIKILTSEKIRNKQHMLNYLSYLKADCLYKLNRPKEALNALAFFSCNGIDDYLIIVGKRELELKLLIALQLPILGDDFFEEYSYLLALSCLNQERRVKKIYSLKNSFLKLKKEYDMMKNKKRKSYSKKEVARNKKLLKFHERKGFLVKLKALLKKQSIKKEHNEIIEKIISK